MAHHKRKRPKNRRAGCLLCKPWKVNGFAKSRVDAEQFFAVSVLVGRLTGAAEKPRAILIPSAQVARVCKTSVP